MLMESAASVDTDYWIERTGWYKPRLDVKALAAILDLREDTARQYITRRVGGFPVPLVREHGGNLFSPDQVYKYVLAERPQLRSRVPRMWCPLTPMNPGIFLHGERVSIEIRPGYIAEFALHLWQPSDNRGPIAVAYPAPLPEPAWPCADRLLEKLPDVEAVVVVTAEIQYMTTGKYQAALAVAQRGEASAEILALPGQQVHRSSIQNRWSAIEYGWADLANLLRRDIPWWSTHLRDIDDIVKWTPGREIHKVRPRGVIYSESRLRRLISHAPTEATPRLSNLVDRINRIIETVVSTSDLPTAVEVAEPGLVQAAITEYRVEEVPETPTPEEVTWLLNLPISDPVIAAETTPSLQSTIALEPVVAAVLRFTKSDHLLAAQWLQDLIEPDETDVSALGFFYARKQIWPEEAAVKHWRHRRHRACWIIETDAGAFYATVGTRVPATGFLTEFVADPDFGFFRDSTGTVWPLPASSDAYYNSGYAGTGPSELLSTVLALRQDAAIDVSHIRDSPDKHSPLWRYIQKTPAPLHISADTLNKFVGSP
ncbi:Uncharacterised protein [Mycobacteroides abscessus subsp. massiliense]|nr:Uncharacterised protein [Mycobacteroides abscessus subsp. massiliense]